jgi:hypothetical protein
MIEENAKLSAGPGSFGGKTSIVERIRNTPNSIGIVEINDTSAGGSRA